MPEFEPEFDGFEPILNEIEIEQLKDRTRKFKKGLLIGKNASCKKCLYRSDNCIVYGCRVHCKHKYARVLWNFGVKNWYCYSYNYNGDKK